MLDYRTLNSYETPKALVSMLVDGELSRKTAGMALRETLGGAPLLTIQERSRISEHVKGTLGDSTNPVTDTLIEVFTNPLTYLAFLPELGAAFKLRSVAPKYGAWVREHATLLQTLGFEAGLQQLRGTSTSPLLMHAMDTMQNITRGSRERLTPAFEKMLKTSGLPDIHLGAIGTSSKAYSTRREIEALLQIKLEGLNKDVVEYLPRGLTRDKVTGKLTTDFAQVKRRALVNMTDAQVDAALERFGALDMAKAIREDADSLKALVIGDGTDPEKVVRNMSRLYYSRRGVAGAKGAFSGSAMGRETVQQLFGSEVERALAGRVNKAGEWVPGKITVGRGANRKRVEMTEDVWNQLVVDYSKQLMANKNYVPRNVWVARNSLGEIEEKGMSALYDRGLIPTGSTIGRDRAEVLFDTEDLELLRGVQQKYSGVGATTDAWASMDEASRRYEPNKTSLRRKVNVFDAFDRYRGSMATTHAMFLDEIPQGVLELEKEALTEARKYVESTGQRMVEGTLRPFGIRRNGKAAELTRPLMDLTADEIPVGGYTMADAIDRSYRLMKNQSTKDFLKMTLLPRVVGEATPRGMVSSILLRKNKEMLQWFKGSAASSFIKETPLRGMAQRLEDIADAPLNRYAGESFEHSVARRLYGSHLGLNLSSVVYNLTQPFITAIKYGSLDDMMGGYKQAAKQLSNYYGDLIGNHGIKGLADRNLQVALREKHIRLAGRKTGDLLGVTEDLVGYQDVGLARSRNILNSGKLTFSEKLMIPFQQGELFNRVATGEILMRRAARQGLDPFSGNAGNAARAIQEIKQGVEETQFGAALLNTPGAFMGQGPLGVLQSPLIRQFMSFPLRMATTPFATDARLTDRGLLGAATMAGRAIGYSAIAYEVVKGMTGRDVSPYLAVAGLTQIPGQVFDDRDGPIPVAPVISIPTRMLQGLVAGDKAMFINEMARVLPGGVAGLRVLKTVDPTGWMGVPDSALPGGPIFNQVLWDQPDAEGKLPVLDKNGRLIGQQSRSELLLRAAGLDFNKFGTMTQVDEFLTAQRDQLVQYEQGIIQALLTNDHSRVMVLTEDYERRFGMKPQIDRAQIQNAIRNRTVDRTSRILGRIDPLLRQEYEQVASDQLGGLAPTPENEVLRGEAGAAQLSLQRLMARMGS